MVEFIFGTKYISLSFYWIGWKWGYAIMKIVDSNNETKIRLSKCKIVDNFPETTMYEWEDVDPIYVVNKNITQVNHINFKTVEEMEACFTAVREAFQEISCKNKMMRFSEVF